MERVEQQCKTGREKYSTRGSAVMIQKLKRREVTERNGNSD